MTSQEYRGKHKGNTQFIGVWSHINFFLFCVSAPKEILSITCNLLLSFSPSVLLCPGHRKDLEDKNYPAMVLYGERDGVL